MFPLAIAVAVLYFGLLLRLSALALVRNINGPAYIAQIQKLVMANRIDKAIKLSNAAPNASLAQAVKRLLTQANRPYAAELAYQQGLYVLKAVKSTADTQFSISQLGLVSLAVLALLGGADPDAEIPIYIAVGLNLGCSWVWLGFHRSFSGQPALLMQIRDLILLRSDYLPPQYRVYKGTAEELKKWQESVNAFEADIAQRKAAGEFLDTNEEYDKQAGPDGVLPPL